MGDFPAKVAGADPVNISCYSLGSCYEQTPLVNAVAATRVSPLANLAWYIPFTVQRPFLAQLMAIGNGATVSGNADVGIYDVAGSPP